MGSLYCGATPVGSGLGTCSARFGFGITPASRVLEQARGYLGRRMVLLTSCHDHLLSGSSPLAVIMALGSASSIGGGQPIDALRCVMTPKSESYDAHDGKSETRTAHLSCVHNMACESLGLMLRASG